MAKSSTRKKFVKNPRSAVPKDLTNLAADYIKDWTARELGRIQIGANKPLCVPLKNGYRVGLYKIETYPNRVSDLFDQNQEFVHRFENKVSAILYAIYTTKKQYSKADEILSVDKEINKFYSDIVYLRHGIEAARQRNDHDLIDIKQSRLEIAEYGLKLARDKILKIHNTAKYYKVWE